MFVHAKVRRKLSARAAKEVRCVQAQVTAALAWRGTVDIGVG